MLFMTALANKYHAGHQVRDSIDPTLKPVGYFVGLISKDPSHPLYRGDDWYPKERVPVLGGIKVLFLSLVMSGRGSGLNGHPQGW